jgi:hypothetical protein
MERVTFSPRTTRAVVRFMGVPFKRITFRMLEAGTARDYELTLTSAAVTIAPLPPLERDVWK